MGVTRHAYEVDGWGVGELWLSDAGVVVGHEAPRSRQPSPRAGGASTRPAAAAAPAPLTTPRGTPGVPTETLSKILERNCNEFVPDLLQRVHRYFAGERPGFGDVALDLDGCTAFQRAVTDVLRAVPYGEVVAYGEVAALAGYPRAGRAVGTYCARNRYFLFVPCHRVVAAGGIGPYGSLGRSYKRRLLRLEGHDAL